MTEQYAETAAVPCCDYRDHASGECLCDQHDASALHPLGRYWFGTHNDGTTTPSSTRNSGPDAATQFDGDVDE